MAKIWDDDDEQKINDYGNLKITKRQLFKHFEGRFEDFEGYSTKYKKAKEFRSQRVSERHLEVVYICGPSGSGKTTIAKYFAQLAGFDAFVSGSGEDFMDGYDNEECIVLDDFRAGTMLFSEVLKLLDNHTNSSVKSRYFNKDISNCKLIFITTVLRPRELYSKKFEESDEPFEQFARRIKHHYYKIDTKIINDKKEDILYEYKLNKDGTEEPINAIIKTEKIFDLLGIKKEESDDSTMMFSIFGKLKEKLDEANTKSSKDNKSD